MRQATSGTDHLPYKSSYVFCHHFSINSVPENDDIYQYNKEVDEFYGKRMEEWQKFLSKKETHAIADFPKDPF